LHDDPGRRCSVVIVVLDNGSQDGSAAEVRARFPSVKVIQQVHRDGFGSNHNSAIRSADSRHVFVLNEDTRVPPGTLDGLVDYLDAHPQVAIAGPKIVGFDGRQQGSAWRLMSVPIQLLWALTLGQAGAVVSRGKEPRRVGAVSACALMARREPFARIGLFDEAYFIFSEEADIAQRLARVGGEIHYVPTVIVEHLGQQSTQSVPDRQVVEHWRSLDLYLRRYHGPVERRVLTWLTGLGYALATAVAEVVTRFPKRLRPRAAQAWQPAVYRRHARQAFRPPATATGIREAAEAFNAGIPVIREPAARTGPGS
jgi:GT2 family glycosyltransferase